MFVMIINIFLY